MDKKALEQIASHWDQMTHKVLALEEIPLLELQGLLTETYRALHLFHKKRLVPKEVCKILLETDSFLYFASLMEEKEFNFYYYQAIVAVAEALKEGFFSGEYPCDFPNLTVFDAKKAPHVLDLENGRIEDLI